MAPNPKQTMMSEYEEVLEKIRPFGPFQLRVFLLVSLFETPLAWAMLVPIFTAASPGFDCDDKQADDLYLSNNLSAYDSIKTNSSNWCHKNSTCTFKSDFSSIVTEWSLICGDKYIGELITSVQMAGVLVGALITGQLGDILGRKKVLFAEYSLLIIVWFSTAFAPSWQIYAALRFVVGGLIGGCLVVNFVLPLEFVTPAWRTFCGCVGFWAVGIMTLAPWAYFIRHWRVLNIAMSTSSIGLLALWWFVDESPRWLLSRGHLEEAKDIIKKAAKFNKRDVPDMIPLEDFVKRLRTERERPQQYSYWHLFSSFQLGKGTLICMFGWFVMSSSYYGLNFNSKNLAGNRYLNVFLAGFVEIPALIFVLYANNKLGRRKTTFILLFLAGISCFSILFIDIAGKLTTWSTLTITMAMMGKSCVSGGWAAIQILSAETFPTVIRNIGIGSCSMAARIGGILAPQLVLLGETSKPVPFTVFGICAILCSLLVLLLDETVGIPLKDRLLTMAVTVPTGYNGDIPLTTTESQQNEDTSIKMGNGCNESTNNQRGYHQVSQADVELEPL